MIHQHNCHHRFGNRHRTDTDARIVTAFGDHLYLFAFTVDGAPRYGDAGSRLQRQMRDHRLAAADPPEDPACVVTIKTVWCDFVTILAAAFGDNRKTVTDFHAFHRIDAHQRM